jgi:peptidoglycan/LPS O-acetylase OafA/YrhL
MKESAVANASGPVPRSGGGATTLAANFDLRHNSIAFLRMMFSALVVVGHAWELGGYGRDPLARLAGVPLGVFALHAFFVLGGFLVAGSFEHSRSWRRYLANRALRLFPGYWTCLLFTAACLVPIASALSSGRTEAGASANALQASRYVVANFLLRINQSTIGDLFAGNPASGVINGSLWSLFPEMLCYSFLALIGVAGALRAGRRWTLVLTGLIAWLLYAGTPRILDAFASSPWQTKVWYLLQLDSLLVYFCGGALLWTFRAVIPFSRPVRYLGLFAAVVALASGWHRVLGPLALPPAILALAIMLPWQNFDQHGDFSYGLYLYHYPLQQILFAAGFGAASSSPLTFFLVSLVATFPLAWLSWKFIERPALKLKPVSLHRVGV